MIYYGIDIRPLEQLYPELWLEFVQLDSFFNTKPKGFIGFETYKNTWKNIMENEQQDLEDLLKELSKLMSVALGIAIDQLPHKYYEI